MMTRNTREWILWGVKRACHKGEVLSARVCDIRAELEYTGSDQRLRRRLKELEDRGLVTCARQPGRMNSYRMATEICITCDNSVTAPRTYCADCKAARKSVQEYVDLKRADERKRRGYELSTWA